MYFWGFRHFWVKTPTERAYLQKLRSELKERLDKGERDIIIRYKIGIPTVVKNNPKNVYSSIINRS